MKTSNILSAVALTTLVLTGCDENPELSEGLLTAQELQDLEERERVTYRTIYDNGAVLNGEVLNGIRFNGIRFNGIRFNGIRFNGIRFNGSLLNSFRRRSNSSKVVAEDPVTHEEYEASELESSEVELDTVDDSVTNTDERVKIENVVQSVSQPDVYFNMVKYKKMPDNIWESMCHDGNGNPVEAIALRSTWNSTTGADLEDSDGLTWACRGAALAKCVEWGYRRWSAHGGTSLKNYHKACTRMVRGDYCGAGVPHTSNGTPIDIADDLGINSHDAVAGVGGWEIEAKWGPNGAVCLNNPRKTTWTHANIGCSIPYCNNDQDDYEGALLMSVTQQTN